MDRREILELLDCWNRYLNWEAHRWIVPNVFKRSERMLQRGAF